MACLELSALHIKAGCAFRTGGFTKTEIPDKAFQNIQINLMKERHESATFLSGKFIAYSPTVKLLCPS